MGCEIATPGDRRPLGDALVYLFGTPGHEGEARSAFSAPTVELHLEETGATCAQCPAPPVDLAEGMA